MSFGPALNQVPSMADLQGYTASIMEQYKSFALNGYYEDSPEGGGTYVWIPPADSASLTPDGGTIIAPSDHPGTCAFGCLKRDNEGGGVPITVFGCKGDNLTLNDTALNNAIVSAGALENSSIGYASGFNLYLPLGQFKLQNPPSNPLGVPLEGPGTLLVQHNPTDISLGFYRYWLNDVDDHRIAFGQEYLDHLHYRLESGSSEVTIALAGDSTMEGYAITNSNYLPQNLMVSNFQSQGYMASVTNYAVGGTGVGDLLTQISDATVAASDIIVICFGINDTEGTPDFITTYRAALAHFRSLKSYLDLTIVIKTPNIVTDTPDGRDESLNYTMRQALRQVCRDYQCFFFDTALMMRDMRIKNGYGPANVFMDEPYNLDGSPASPPPGNDPSRVVHPLERLNQTIFGAMCGYLLGDEIAIWKYNRFLNLGSYFQSTITIPPSSYPQGLMYANAQTASGYDWPVPSILINQKVVDGPVLQTLYTYTNNPQVLFRTSDGASAYSGFLILNNQPLTPFPTLQNGWTAYTIAPNAKIVNNVLYLGGVIQGGTTTTSTTLFTLPIGFRASIDRYFTVPCNTGLAGSCTLRVFSSGDVIIQSAPTDALICLDGITLPLYSYP